jgi:two-component system sensor histidine kinase KdpD
MSQDDTRPDPDALLAQVQLEENADRTGRLYLFLGMCPGVGKTYAMLEAARQRQREGVNVLIGIVETHGRHETAALVQGLPILPLRKLEHRGHTLEEFDLDSALQQRPDLLLVDELAHSNAPGSRHAKRYQDVLELLDAGIDVCTTLNVQHIESQVDTVRQISGISIQETVPDSILDRAQEIQLIDLSVEKLLQRLAEGRVYMGERAEWASSNFFQKGNLTALRELALRFTAEQVDRSLEDIRRQRRITSPWKTHARLMVGIGPSPYAESLIRWTRRAANRLGCPWLVGWVETSRKLTVAEQDRLTRALGLARRLGAEIVSATGESISEALLRIARERNVTQIVVGKPERAHLLRQSLADRLIAGSGDIDVCVVRPFAASASRTEAPSLSDDEHRIPVAEYAWAALVTVAVGVLSWIALPLTGYVFVALLFLLAIVITSLRLSRGPVLAMAALCALSWNYFFIPPRFTFHIEQPHDLLMFVMFFIVALSMGHLTSRLRQREEAERRRLRQTSALLRVTQSAALTVETQEGLKAALRTIDELLGAQTALIVRELDHTLPRTAHAASSFNPTEKEWGVIAWSYENRQPAGRFTATLPESGATWFPLQTATSMMGVLGLALPEHASLDFTARQTVEAFALQLALVLEKEHFIQAASHAEVLERSEKLRRTLLDSVSHELKTPLAVLHAALEGLAQPANPYVKEIHTATRRLQRVVDHLLHITRIESSVVEPRREWCEVSEIIEDATSAVEDVLTSHPLQVSSTEGMPLVHVDAVLLSQALANILHNACVYTPAGTVIEVDTRLRENQLRITVRDQGPGLPDGAETKVFEKFYRAPGSPAGGTGLGLAIARGLMRAQGGDLTAHNHPEGGAVFVMELPVSVQPHSQMLEPALPS